MSGEEFFDKAMQAVLDGDEDGAVEIANRAIAEGINPVAMINEGLTPGMTQVGDLFAKEEYALPQVLLSADAMKKAIEVLEPHISKEEAADKLGVVVIGTVQGDIHDIGKNIVATMFRIHRYVYREGKGTKRRHYSDLQSYDHHYGGTKSSGRRVKQCWPQGQNENHGRRGSGYSRMGESHRRGWLCRGR